LPCNLLCLTLLINCNQFIERMKIICYTHITPSESITRQCRQNTKRYRERKKKGTTNRSHMVFHVSLLSALFVIIFIFLSCNVLHFLWKFYAFFYSESEFLTWSTLQNLCENKMRKFFFFCLFQMDLFLFFVWSDNPNECTNESDECNAL
jgi:hypothetical protein